MERSARFRTDLRVKRHRIVLNVSGHRFMAEKSSLKRYPHTLLGSDLLACFFDESKQEYFFDRDPYLFRYILNYYNCGKLHASPDDCPVAFKDELDYFGIPLHEMEECCWLTAYDKREKNHGHYAVRRTSIKAVHTAPARYIDWKRRGSNRGNEIKAANAEEIVCNDSRISHLGPTSKNNKCAHSVHKKARFSGLETATQEQPSHMDEIDVDRNCNRHSSRCGCKPPGARVQNAFNLFYGLFITLSVAVTAIETVDCSEGIKCEAMYRTTFFVADSIFVGVFTLEFLIRFILSRNRCAFMKDVFNLVDLVAILPYYLSLIISYFMETSDVTVLITLRVLRVSRIMKLTRGSTRLQSLLYTLRNCSTDLVFLYFTFTLGILLFASALYYVEKDDNPANFTSIPHSLWYTCVTMMTTGYGDVVPLTTLGKIIGGICCICGVVIMSLPIPIMQDKKVVVLG